MTVADTMLRRPTVHPADLTVAQARAAFGASPKTRLLLLVHGERLVGAVTREDLAGATSPSEPAARVGSLGGRTVAPGVPLEQVRASMVARGERRLAVVDPQMRLLGLLCLKRSRAGFCSDAGVAALRASRQHAPTPG